MSRLMQYHNAVITQLKNGLSGVANQVESHHAPINSAEEIKRFSSKSPAVIITIPRILQVEYSGATLARLQCAAFVLAKNKGNQNRDLIAATIVERALQQIPEQRWGIKTYGTPENIEGRPLYSNQVDKLGIALWGIAWRQIIELEPLTDAATLDDFLTAHGDHYAAKGNGTDAQGIEIPLASDTVNIPQT